MAYNLANSSWNKSEYKSMQSVIKSGFFTMGRHVKEFEEEFLSYMKNNHADALADLAAGKLTDSAFGTIEKVAADLTAKYKVEA